MTKQRHVTHKMEFNGDIIITDPCYLMRARHHGTEPLTKDDWGFSHYGYNLEALGIHKYMTRDTIYGDWSCSVFDADTHEKIGAFCADAGLVVVADLSEVLKYNPHYADDIINKPFSVTCIKDFKGEVCFVEVTDEDGYTSLKIEGRGVNTKSWAPVNFVTSQTGF